MGYFSNGTEGDCYEAEYCSKCVHHEADPEKPGCMVMTAHVLFAYEECNNKSNAANILELLIPRKGAFNGRCKMFTPAGGRHAARMESEAEKLWKQRALNAEEQLRAGK